MKILVLSRTDACCGPMAAAFLRDYSPSIEAVSAGQDPVESIDPLVVVAMKECLVDLSGYRPQKASDFDSSDFDRVYECPDFPVPETLEECRQLRDFIKNDAYLFFQNKKTAQH